MADEQPERGEPVTDVMYAIRRADGDDIGDYSFYICGGPDDWQPAVDDADCAEEPIEYELVRFDTTVVGTRTLGPDKPVCERWEGTHSDPVEWWEVVVKSLSEDTWPARDHGLNQHHDSEVDANLYIAALPDVFILHDGWAPHEVRRDQLVVERFELKPRPNDCTKCGRGWWSHKEYADA